MYFVQLGVKLDTILLLNLFQRFYLNNIKIIIKDGKAIKNGSNIIFHLAKNYTLATGRQ